MKTNTPLNPMERTTRDQPGQGRGRTRRGFLMDMYRRLYRAYGPQGWWPGDGPFEVVLGAILTQAAAWTNVERALASLKAEDCWSLEAINRRPQEELAAIIRSSGYFNAKARKLKAFASHVLENYGGDLGAFLSRGHNKLREELLGIYGIGPETADDIALYAAGQPSFVIDAYTRRIIDRLGPFETPLTGGYRAYQDLFQDNLDHDTGLFQEYHALLDRHAKEACAKVPRCSGCCLLDLCATGQDNVHVEGFKG